MQRPVNDAFIIEKEDMEKDNGNNQKDLYIEDFTNDTFLSKGKNRVNQMTISGHILV